MTSAVWAIMGALLAAFTAGFALALNDLATSLWCILASIMLTAFVFWPETKPIL